MVKYIQSCLAGHWLQLLLLLLIMFAFFVLNVRVNGKLPNSTVEFTILHNAREKGAVCLDGSEAGYFYSKGYGVGVNNWMVHLQGGGWCGTKESCVERVTTQPGLGSTVNITPTFFGGILSPLPTDNLDFHNWNRVSIHYCDGASFVGDVKEVDSKTNLYFRGMRIFNGVVDELLQKGMNKSQNVFLVGNSAGGLAAILHCDRFRERVPSATRLKCLSDSGFFIRAKNLTNWAGREWNFDRVVELHGAEKDLPMKCMSRMIKPGLCFFPENVVGDIKTPLFLLNSAFDRFQITVNLNPNPADKSWESCTNRLETCTPTQLQTISDFHKAFLNTTLANTTYESESRSRGLFINSCYIHDYIYSTQRWNSGGSPRLGNKTIAQAVADWYFDRTTVKLIDNQTHYPLDCHLP